MVWAGKAPHLWRLTVLLICALGLVVPGSLGAAELTEDGRLRAAGDIRLRLERDWDSTRPDGSERDDRSRARIRARLALTFDQSDALQFGVRLRTGRRDNQQSPHITVHESSGGSNDEAILVDKWYVKGKRGGLSAQAGRFFFPFWSQNEMFWDNSATPAGVSASHVRGGEAARLTFNLAHLTLPDGMTHFNGNLTGGQVVASLDRERYGLTLAGGLFLFDGESGARNLRNGNGARDYRIGTASAQWRLRAGGRPLVFGVDAMHNFENYASDDPDPFTAANRDETDGYALSVRYGSTQAKGDWLIAYHYARIETFAVNASYAGDDWVRWGSSSQTDASDLKGHELRGSYRFTHFFDLVARLFLVDAITSPQDGNRFRLDLNFRF